MEIAGDHQTWQVDDLEGLRAVLAWRDSKGGAIFWIGEGYQKCPELAICISGESAHIHYFPEDGHPGFRCVGGEGLPQGGMTKFVFEGCDPGTGEDTPNGFVVSLMTVWLVTKEFFLSKRMSNSVSWFEL